MAIGNLAFADERRVERDEVFHRARGTSGTGRSLSLLIVNISPCGLMARCEDKLAEGDLVRLLLPAVGPVSARVRWSLGGRIGCEFDRIIPLARYYELLAMLLKN